MSDARRRAEKALRMFDRTATPKPHEVYLYRAIAALREILAEEAPPAADEVREAAEAWREATQLVVFVPARLSRALHALSALAARGATASPAPKSDEVREAAERLDFIGDAWSRGDTDAKEMYRCGRRLLSALAARGGAG